MLVASQDIPVGFTGLCLLRCCCFIGQLYVLCGTHVRMLCVQDDGEYGLGEALVWRAHSQTVNGGQIQEGLQPRKACCRHAGAQEELRTLL